GDPSRNPTPLPSASVSPLGCPRNLGSRLTRRDRTSATTRLAKSASRAIWRGTSPFVAPLGGGGEGVKEPRRQGARSEPTPGLRPVLPPVEAPGRRVWRRLARTRFPGFGSYRTPRPRCSRALLRPPKCARRNRRIELRDPRVGPRPATKPRSIRAARCRHVRLRSRDPFDCP